MSDPTTANILLAAPIRGADVGTWDVPVNNNSTAIDGFFGGVTTVSLTNTNVALSAPTGTVVPGGGPFQSQNRILKFTGVLSANVTVTFPLPGEYTIQNLTTGNFVVIFAAAGVGNVVSTPQGSIMHVWNDGTNVYIVKNMMPGALTFLGGVTAVPAWINANTIPPYLLCDGSIYNYTTYPALGNLYGANFGGNGITTFGVEDLRGRVPLAYDGTGARITVLGCGISGQTLGAVNPQSNPQVNQLTTANLPPYTPAGTFVGNPISNVGIQGVGSYQTGGGAPQFTATAVTPSGTFVGTPQGGTSTFVNNVQPSQVAGIWLVST